MYLCIQILHKDDETYHASRTFGFSWKEKRWEYRRPKVTYVPAERNMVAVIPNWFEVKLADDKSDG